MYNIFQEIHIVCRVILTRMKRTVCPVHPRQEMIPTPFCDQSLVTGEQSRFIPETNSKPPKN